MRLLDLPARVGLSDDDWWTPPEVFAALGVTFDLDPAAPPGGVPWLPARRIYCEQDDGLTRPWEGLVWLNPPYSRPGPWLERLAGHGSGIALIAADPSCRWWHDWIAPSAALVVFPRGRIRFVHPARHTSTHGRFPSAFIAYGDRAAEVLAAAGLGHAVVTVGGV